MKFFSILLKEGRKEDLRKKYSTKFNSEDLDFILNISDLQDFNHKYTDFVLKNTDGDGELDTYTIEQTIEAIKDFDKYQSQLEKKDINQYESYLELEKALYPVRVKEKQKEAEKLVDKIYEDNQFLVLRPLSEEASCKYGSNTKWCVTSKGSGHYQRYTSQGQKLYFIINKEKSNNRDFAKIAVHYDNDGTARFYDSQDQTLTQREISILKYAFPEMIEKIDEDFKKGFVSGLEKFLQSSFDISNTAYKKVPKFLGTNKDLIIDAHGFENVRDLGYGHAVGKVEISLVDNEKTQIIDGYDTFLMYSLRDNRSFNLDLGFQGFEETELDLGLEDKEIKSKILISGSLEGQNKSLLNYIANKVFEMIWNSPVLEKYLHGDNKVFTSTYGYTFGKNKGWISKLIKYLDSGKIGTKLDFLTDIGYLERVVKDGKTKYKRRNYIMDPRQLRGQHSSFFAAAKNAGILGYRKVGREFFLTKGPNFDAYKEGKLKAL